MSGTLVLVVGPSGAGKDTLMRMAADALDPARFHFAERCITRNVNDHETHQPVSAEEFEALRASSSFAFDWQAHGLSYGVPSGIKTLLEQGVHVIVNGSRALIPTLAGSFQRIHVVHVYARPDVLEARLHSRGREDASNVASRMERPELPAMPEGVSLTSIDNSGTPEQGAAALIACLSHLDASQLSTPSLVTTRTSPMTTILTNARIVTEDNDFIGTIAFDETGILNVDEGVSQLPEAVDCGGDYVIPGLIECHTDNMERHFMPRPKVFWPNPVAAIMSHDAQIAAAGITTVYDSVCAGIYDRDKDFRNAIFRQMIDAVGAGMRDDLFRVDHKLHLRCELSDPKAPELIELELGNPLIGFVSLMDHTPGVRQWRDEAHFKTFIRGEGVSDAEADRIIADRKAIGEGTSLTTWPKVAAMFRDTGIPMASHDDTTVEHVDEAVSSGCTISEFPTSMVAAIAAKKAGLKTVAGAPNVVRGGSHSGNVAVRDLAVEGALDVLSSDYVPSSLLQAIHALTMDPGFSMSQAVGLVTWNAADMLGLPDRGRLEAGKRSDIVRLRFVGATPVIARVWSMGRIAH